MATYTASILIQAPADKVFEAITQPELVKLWQFGKELITNWTPGHSIRFQVHFEGKTLQQWGTVLAFLPNALLKYQLFTPKPGMDDLPENYVTTSYKVTPRNEHTEIELTQEDPTVTPFKTVNLMPILVALKAVVES